MKNSQDVNTMAAMAATGAPKEVMSIQQYEAAREEERANHERMRKIQESLVCHSNGSSSQYVDSRYFD